VVDATKDAGPALLQPPEHPPDTRSRHASCRAYAAPVVIGEQEEVVRAPSPDRFPLPPL